jgi:hypothetical protein
MSNAHLAVIGLLMGALVGTWLTIAVVHLADWWARRPQSRRGPVVMTGQGSYRRSWDLGQRSDQEK